MADEPKKPTLSNMEAIVAEAIYKDLGAEKRTWNLSKSP